MAPNYSANDSHSTPPIKSTAVAIDKDKNSPYAVRWAIDHLMVISNPLITLIHVRPKTNHLNRRYSLSLFHYYLAYILPCRYYSMHMSICIIWFLFLVLILVFVFWEFLQRAPMMLITQPNLKTTVSSSHTADIVLVKGYVRSCIYLISQVTNKPGKFMWNYSVHLVYYILSHVRIISQQFSHIQ